jgi:two-component system cell cycle sensor histidine kinase/response regulator CckA
MKLQPPSLTPRNRWGVLSLTALLTLVVLAVSVSSLASGLLTIFQNLFYFPIILACVYYVKRGFVFSIVLAFSYYFLLSLYSQDPAVLEGGLVRVVFFILVAGVITYLSVVRIRAEEALKESEEFNRGLVENIPNMVIVCDSNRNIRYVNPAATSTLGYSSKEMLGTDIIAYVIPCEHDEIATAMRERFSSGGERPLEIDLNTKEGKHLTVISTGAPLEFHDQPAVLILLADISARKKAEDELRKAHDELEFRVTERTRELLRANEDLQEEIAKHKQTVEKLSMSESDLRQAQAVAHVGSWYWDIVHDKLSWSGESYRIFGIDPTAFAGSWQDIIVHGLHPDDIARVDKATRAAISRHEPRSLEYRVIRPDGSIRTVWDVTGEMILDDRGNVSSLTGVMVDITERKQVEAQLHQAEKMEAIGQLASGIAHDFNNQLTGILGNVALMRSSVAPGDPVLEYVNGAELGARHAADLTRALLTFSRSALALPVPLDPNTAIETSLSIARQSLPATMGIARDFEAAPWHILMDRSQLTQILLNLALNARDAMGGKGTLTIRVRNASVDEAYVRSHTFSRTGDFVHLTVADTGPGIPPAIMSRLFEPFFTTKPAGTGTGLGLAVVYGAVKQAGGWITVDSLPGAGATFDVFLPRCLDELPAPVTAEVATAQVCSGTILVIEDEPIVCTVTQALLTHSGYTVLTAQGGASALAVLRDHAGAVDLVLLDMTMPGLTTDEVLRGIRALDPMVPVLLTSGYTSTDAVKRMLEEGTAQGFMAKPYDLQQLLRSIGSALNGV